uniref:Putative minor tail protein n=1 Tax=viral metagenome TaxID=1070528 RepID=A0A6M3J3S5_9ZZZZ
MANGFELKIDLSDSAEDVAALMAVTVDQVKKAAQRALVKTGQWLRTHSVRELGQELGIVQAPLAKRFRVYPRHAEREVRFWVGLDPIGLHRLGSPRVTAKGVRVNRKEYEGGFISPMHSSQLTVYKRKGRERLPIEMVTEDIEQQARAVIERWERRVFDRFSEIFQQEAAAVLNGYA